MVTGDGLACKRWVTTGQRRWIKNTEYRRKMVFLSTLRFKMCVCVCVYTHNIFFQMHESVCSSLPGFLVQILTSCFIVPFLKGTSWINDPSHTQSFLEFPQIGNHSISFSVCHRYTYLSQWMKHGFICLR